MRSPRATHLALSFLIELSAFNFFRPAHAVGHTFMCLTLGSSAATFCTAFSRKSLATSNDFGSSHSGAFIWRSLKSSGDFPPGVFDAPTTRSIFSRKGPFRLNMKLPLDSSANIAAVSIVVSGLVDGT
eukprot:2330700-Prymnesium_polylepis.2